MPQTFTVEPSSLTSIRDKVILITGGSSGIGLSTAQLLLSLSPTNRVAILDRAAPPPSAVSGPRVLFHECDVNSWRSQRAGFEVAARAFGRLDVVFVNAGINEVKDEIFSEELDEEGKLKEPTRKVLDIDLAAAAATVKLAVHHLRKNGADGGSIVLTASMAGYVGAAGAPLYGAAKHGLVGLLRSLKGDTKKFNVAISLVAPGITLTPMANTVGTIPKELDKAAAKLTGEGLAFNRVETVSLAVGHLIKGGIKSNGVGLLIQGDRILDIEQGYAKSRESMMSLEMLDLFKGGRKAVLYSRVEAKAKI